MIHGIRTVHLLAFASCALWAGCHQAPDPAQLTAVDQLITTTDAALLTLNELDRTRYHRSDSLFQEQRDSFAMYFHDTLDRYPAKALGDQFIALRASQEMGAAHERMIADIATSSERLRTLRTDIANAAMGKAQATSIVAAEQQRHTIMIEAVHRVIDNYRLLQLAWDRRDSVASLIADTNPPMVP